MQEKCENGGQRDQEKEPHTCMKHNKDVASCDRGESTFLINIYPLPLTFEACHSNQNGGFSYLHETTFHPILKGAKSPVLAHPQKSTPCSCSVVLR
jgi:hypothetical protein